MNSLSDPTPVRLLETQVAEVNQLSTETGVDVSKLLRLCVKEGLPKVISQFGLNRTTSEAGAAERATT